MASIYAIVSEFDIPSNPSLRARFEGIIARLRAVAKSMVGLISASISCHWGRRNGFDTQSGGNTDTLEPSALASLRYFRLGAMKG